MTPGTLNIAIYHGDTYRWQFTLWQDPGKTTPADLTGVIPKAEIRTAAGGTLLTSMDLTVEPPNVIQAILPTAKTQLLKGGGVWDLQLTYPDGDVQTVLQGSVSVTMDVTDSTAVGTTMELSPAARTIPGRPV
jgi:hypothetical protein